MDVMLTRREREIARLIIEFGFSNKAIAQQLDITPGTVQNTIAKIYRACNIRVGRDYRRFELLKGVTDGDINIIDKGE